MSKAGKITAAILGAFLLLIVVAIILIATFDWNRLKPTINQKVSAELNRPFRYPWRSGRGVGAAKTRNWLAQLGAGGPMYTRKTSFLAIHRIFPKSRWCICHA
ncbi:putative outer membrane assembly protein [Escherichia coli]|uniref:Putative outer membrane assembly protein n=1 Tax=Escherichia coli TaxID=562 RepID=A0A377ALQ9_ECOLX|nr:putative outer membrane assembly protein [Escherichia coli]